MAEVRFHTLLREKIEEKRALLLDELASGGAKDYAGYQHIVGYIQGLNEALLLCDDVEKEYQ